MSAADGRGAEAAGADLMVKICGITTEADALLGRGPRGRRRRASSSPPRPARCRPAAVADIVKRLPHGVLTVGVFRDEAPARVVEIANHIGLGAVQLHGHETAEDSRWVRQRVPRTIKAFPAGDRTIGRFAEFGADYLLIDGASPGSGEVFDWRLAEGVVDPTPADRLGRAAPRERGRGHGPPAPLRGRRRQRGGGGPGSEGPPASCRDFVANARRPPASWPLGRRGAADGRRGRRPRRTTPYDWRDDGG